MEFDWDEHNLFHIRLHGVSRDDVESALAGSTVVIKDEVRQGEDRRSVLGKTRDGRILVVITTPRAGKTRCVTAFPANRFFRGVFGAKRPGAER